MEKSPIYLKTVQVKDGTYNECQGEKKQILEMRTWGGSVHSESERFRSKNAMTQYLFHN